MTRVKGLSTVGAIAVFGAVSVAVLAPTASGDDTIYTVFAYSRSTGAFGWADNYRDLEGAAVRAMHECQNHPIHPSDCKFVDGASSPGCLALVVSPDRTIVKGVVGNTRADASAAALSRVPGGEVLATACSNGTEGPNGGSAWPQDRPGVGQSAPANGTRITRQSSTRAG